MQNELKILLLEDNAYDAKLNVVQLNKDKISFVHKLVDNKADFIVSLTEYQPDIILSDFSLPQFTGLDALEIVKEKYPELPFIMVTGSLDEETAVVCLKQGAWDYVIKDHLVRLGPAVKNAIQRRDDVLKKKAAERALLESEKKFRDFVLLLPEVIFEADLEGKLTFVNERAFELFRMTFADFERGLNVMEMIALEDYEKAQLNLKAVLSGEEPNADEYLLIKKSGEIFPAMVHVSPNIKDKVQIGFSGVLIDITERKKAEQNLIKSLHEKEILLKEVHHRVKNNMQIISSMLKLQMRHIENEEAKVHLMDSHHRVRSMALIHEKLYQAKDFEEIDFADYIKGLSAYIFASYQTDTQRINLKIDIKNVMLNINTAIPCGLIINELITNTLKHAFPNKAEGSLSIKMEKLESESFVLEVQDTGIGLPADVDPNHVKTLGLQLITSLVQQLNGEMKYSNCNGTCFRLEFTQK